MWVLVGAVIVGELVPIKLGTGEGEVAPSTTFTFALLLSTGLAAAAIARGRRPRGSATSSTASAPRAARSTSRSTCLAIGAAGGVLLAAGVLPHHEEFTAGDVPAILAAAAVFFVVNTGLVAGAIALTSGTRLRDQISSELIRQSATEGILLGLAPLAVLALDSAPVLLPLLALPMIAVQRAGRQALIAEHLALHDALTGLPNRVLFRTRTQHAIHVAGRAETRRGRDAARPRPLQGDQRHARPPLRRRGAAPGRARACRACCARRTPSRAWAATSSRSSCARSRRPPRASRSRPARPARHRRALRRGRRAPGARRQRRHRLLPRARPGRRRRSCSAPTSPCTRPRRAGPGVERYVPELDGNSVQRLALAGDLRTALEREEFVLHYQPKVDLRTNAVTRRRGAAALGAPRARLAAARRVHPAGRAHRPDRAADQLRASTTRCARWARGARRGSTSASPSTSRRAR